MNHDHDIHSFPTQRRKSTEARERLKWNRSATKNIQQRRDSCSSNASSDDRSSQSSRPTTAGREEGIIYTHMSYKMI